MFKTKETWHEISFSEKGKIDYLPWFCPGSGCGGFLEEGTYEIKGNKIIAIFTKTTNDLGEVTKLKEPDKWNFTIINDNQIEMDGNKFTWQKNFED